jgi:hypothetical protein
MLCYGYITPVVYEGLTVGRWWSDTDRGNPKCWDRNLSQCHSICAMPIPEKMAWDWIRPSAFRGLRLTAWHLGLKQNNAFYSSHWTYHVVIMKCNWLILFRTITPLIIVRTTRNTPIICVGELQGFLMLKQAVYIFTSAIWGLSRRDALSSSSSWCVGFIMFQNGLKQKKQAGPLDNHLDLKRMQSHKLVII